MKRILTLFSITAVSIISAWSAPTIEDVAKHDPDMADAIKYAKEHGSYDEANKISPSDVAQARAIVNGRFNINLLRQGMSPETVEKAAWAAEHAPNSTCARLARQINAFPNDETGSSEVAIIKIERNHICDRKNLK